MGEMTTNDVGSRETKDLLAHTALSLVPALRTFFMLYVDQFELISHRFPFLSGLFS